MSFIRKWHENDQKNQIQPATLKFSKTKLQQSYFFASDFGQFLVLRDCVCVWAANFIPCVALCLFAFVRDRFLCHSARSMADGGWWVGGGRPIDIQDHVQPPSWPNTIAYSQQPLTSARNATTRSCWSGASFSAEITSRTDSRGTTFRVKAIVVSRLSVQCHTPLGSQITSPGDCTHHRRVPSPMSRWRSIAQTGENKRTPTNASAGLSDHGGSRWVKEDHIYVK